YGPLLVDRKLRPRAASWTFPVARASRGFRLGPPLHAARLDVRPTRTALQPGDLIPQRRHQSLKLDQLFPLLDDQAFQLGGWQTVQVIGRRHAKNESDSRRSGNLIIIPP